MNNDKNTKIETDINKNNTEKSIVKKLELFEEDDFFEEFDQDWNDNHIVKEEIDMEKFKQEWEDQEIADNFDVILKEELKIE